ncbi:MAG TPA: mannosyltransferase family protein [Herpetosiphonaceae bacterium]|nr:mannosyltransferase family protein [Herpetosiphonaceae bacterium]
MPRPLWEHARTDAVRQPWRGRPRALLARTRRLGAVLAIFLLSRLAFYLVALFGNDHGEQVNQALTLRIHWRWDALHYYGIAVRGYGAADESAAFFPLLPLLIRGAAMVLGGMRWPLPTPIERADESVLLAGVLLANGAALLAFCLLYELVLADTGDDATAQRAVLYTASFPLAFFYAVPYTEGLFLATSVGAFLAARRSQWIRAGVWAALASITRPVGVLLLPALLLEVLLAWRHGSRAASGWLRAALGLLLAPAGLLLFLLYLWQRVGDPIAFVHVARSEFGHASIFPPALVWRGLTLSAQSIWSDPGSLQRNHLIVFNTFVMLLVLVVLFASFRRWRPAYVLYGLLLCTVVLSTVPDGDTLRSVGRYLMVFFPVYTTVAHWGRRPLVHLAILLFWLPLLGLFTAFFLRGYFVA